MSRVSIIIPCRDDGKYLPDAVRSALEQTHADLEVIIVDDHSRDPATKKVLNRINNGKICVLSLPDNKTGPSAARNMGIAHATGDYILPLDADDRFEPEYAARAASVLDTDTDVGICYCEADYFGLKHGHWQLPEYSFKDLLVQNMIFVSAMFRREHWLAVGGFPEAAVYGQEDHIFWLALADLGVKVVRIPECLFHYRIRKYSRTTEIARQDSDSSSVIFEIHKDIYLRNIPLLYKKAIECNSSLQEIQQSIFYPLFSKLFKYEHLLKKKIKHFFGR